ncbi:MAG: anti-sigma factor family protein [bacterium]
MKHLSDEDLQAYLDGVHGVNRVETEAHLMICKDCQHALEAYRHVYTALQNEPSSVFSLASENAIMQKISIESEKFGQAIEWLLFAISAIFGLAMTGYILMTAVTGEQLSDFVQYIQGLFSFVKSTNAVSPKNISLLLMTSVVLAALHFLDKYLFQKKFKKAV